MFGTADWDDPYWKGKQHIALNLAGLGKKILYIETMGLRAPEVKRKIDISQILKRLNRITCLLCRGNQVNSSINILSSQVIPNTFRNKHIGLINLKILKLSIKTYLGSKRIKKTIILTYRLYMMEIAKCPKIESMKYDCGGKIAAGPGVDRKKFGNKKEKLKKERKVIFVKIRNFKLEGFKKLDNVDYLPNMVDNKHFSKARNRDIPETFLNIKTPKLICRNILLTFRINYELVEEISMNKQGWNIVLKGTEREGKANEIVKRLIRRANVNALGYRSYQELPIYLQHMGIALLPLLIDKNANNMFQLNILGHITTGLKVDSTEIIFAIKRNKEISTNSENEDNVNKAGKLLREGELRLNKILTIIGSNRLADRTRIVQKLIEGSL